MKSGRQGTILRIISEQSIETQNQLMDELKKRGIEHNVLNAKQHEREAEIVAQAGKQGAVTIATNMAGRGTDIMLGGNVTYMAKATLRKELTRQMNADLEVLKDEYEHAKARAKAQGLPIPPAPDTAYEAKVEMLMTECDGHADTQDADILAARKRFDELVAEYEPEVKREAEAVREAGGLFIIGTERHESRRIDNQLRGRCARQGDPGSSKFFLSLEDDLMRLFGSDNISGIMDKLGMEEDEPIEHKLVTKSIESAQKKVEARNFTIRKQVLEYDNVMNQQREVIYSQRRKILQQANLRDTIMEMVHKVVDRTMAMYAPPEVYSEDWDLQALINYAEEFYAPRGLLTVEYLQNLSREELEEYLYKVADEHYAEREAAITPELMRELENLVMLKVVDNHWMEHLDAMDMLREGVGLRAYGQKDPLVEYKFEAYDMFQAMIDAIQDDVVRYIYRVNVITQPKVEDRLENASTNAGDEGTKQPVVKKEEPGRNDPCPCGSGKKYKNCCGKDK